MAFDSTLGYPGEGPPTKLKCVGHNVCGWASNGKLATGLTELRQSPYHVECIQEHNFGESESRAWAQLKSRNFVAAVAWRAPNTTKGGAAIIVDMQKLGEGA